MEGSASRGSSAGVMPPARQGSSCSAVMKMLELLPMFAKLVLFPPDALAPHYLTTGKERTLVRSGRQGHVAAMRWVEAVCWYSLIL